MRVLAGCGRKLTPFCVDVVSRVRIGRARGNVTRTVVPHCTVHNVYLVQPVFNCTVYAPRFDYNLQISP